MAADTPEATAWVTYRLANGDLVWGEYAFVTETEFFDEELSEPIDVVKETWQLVSSEVVTFKPSWWDDTDEDDDAAGAIVADQLHD